MNFPKSKVKQRCAKLVLFLILEKLEQLSPAFSYRANALQARAARERVLQDDEDEDDSERDASMSSLEEASVVVHSTRGGLRVRQAGETLQNSFSAV